MMWDGYLPSTEMERQQNRMMNSDASTWTYNAWWRMMKGEVIRVKWPTGFIAIDQQHEIESADPNDHYRPWLEANVGKQGRDWKWNIDTDDASMMRITFRKGLSKQAFEAYLMWE